MATGYLLVMGCLAVGTRLARRPGPRPAAPGHGWAALLRRVGATAAGGYLVLAAVVTGYYFGVARLGGDFLADALTGTARLLALVLPLWLAASWLTERARARRSRTRRSRARRSQPRSRE
ncbi:DUF6256 family protein [Streptomyces sp. DSM 44917]|uniref:DUF6256 family protein n=1 Tax=Streptomyces boetiae TaxID=3075541 RepID=A0ABU2LBG8_9ACTN|nr:DUF6256 family protein [Streptomyces sp. DSM 44917]MDT0308930.1 DUF6256 family protein [Streptomyces sp. DSM 44917]